jgi:hypothetical protein
MPTLSVADAFFLEELRAAVGHRQASIWLSSTHAKARFDCAHRGSSSSTTPSSTPLTRSPSPPVRRHLSDEVAAVSLSVGVPSRAKISHSWSNRSGGAAALGSPSRAKISHSWSSGRAAQTPHSPADAPAASEDDHRRSDTAAALGSPSRAKISHSWSSGRAAQTPHSPADAPAASEDDEHVKRVLRAGGRDAGLVFTDAAHCVYDVRR